MIISDSSLETKLYSIFEKLLLVCISCFTVLIILEIFLRFVPFVATASYTQPVNKTSPIPHLKPNNKYVYALGWNGKVAIEHVSNNYGFQTPVDFYKDQGSSFFGSV